MISTPPSPCCARTWSSAALSSSRRITAATRCAGFWEAVLAAFENFRYVREIGADISVGARDHALVFEARVGDKQIEGCDFIQIDEAGAISGFTVMVRPMSGMLALAEAMKAQLSTV